MMTGFTRIIIVLGLMRNALGTPTAPPNRCWWGCRCFDLFVMSPVFSQICEKRQPLQENKITMEVA